MKDDQVEFFSVSKILSFKPIVPVEPERLRELKIIMEKYLVQA
jgi:hypothetical protein